MAVREARSGDIGRIQVIRNSVKENTLSDPSLVPDSDVQDYIYRRGKGWVYEENKTIMGFAIVSVLDKNVWALFVDPQHEKRGIGRQLHDQMLDWYFQQMEETIWLGTARGTRAESFYRKAGWIETGIHGKGEIKFEMSRQGWQLSHSNSK
jgi:GNAT superfamily N-acetyltransferase